ncbi:neprilysin-1 [Drosophila innubila]|uniref:neprilysin-1 n=1 Tax=Drosophila innubila TaxID=198719 RepID=UPI00148E745B|nr:neprilysin-1 [Drosophila innubila]
MYGLIVFTLGITLAMGQEDMADIMDVNRLKMQSIRANLDRRVSPCTNFWAFACGNWSAKYVDNFAVAEKQYAQAMAPLLDGGYAGKLIKAPRLLQKMSDYFKACVDNEHKELELPQELRMGDADWTVAAAKLRKYGVNGVFFDEAADVAYNNSLRYVVQLKMPEDESSSSTALGQELLALSKKYRREEPPLQSWTLAELQQQIPQINWQKYFKELLATEPKDVDLLLEVSDVEYLRAVGELLQRSNVTTVEQYLCDRLASLANQAYPRTDPAGRAAACVHHMRAVLPLGMNYIYAQYVYASSEEAESQIDNTLHMLSGMFERYINANRLGLNREQLSYVRQKRHVRYMFGNLPKASNSSEFYNSHYDSANFSSTDFQHNLWQALRLRTYLQHAPLLQPEAAVQLQHYYVNDDVFEARNAPYFVPERNTIIVPLIFMQPPLHDPRQHAVLRHGLLGFILAHELSHAFEHEGIVFDAAGNESPIGLSIRQLPKFQSALECFEKTPTTSLKERLADVNGLQLAYDAFFGLHHNSSEFEYRPYEFEREFLAPQLFHLSFAQFFCGRLPPAIGHDMDDVRVNEAERNLPQFAIDFKCAPPTQSIACEMWRPGTKK